MVEGLLLKLAEIILVKFASWILEKSIRGAVVQLKRPELKEQVRDEVYKRLPGDFLDPIVWGAIENCWDALLLLVEQKADRLVEVKDSEAIKLVAKEIVDEFRPTVTVAMHRSVDHHIA